MRESRFWGDREFKKLDPIPLVEFSDWVLMLHGTKTDSWYESFPRSHDVPKEPGVYELGVGDARDEPCAKYIGATSNLRRRFKHYAANGSHLARRIEKALRKNKRVWFRFHVDRGYKHTEKRARACLNYAWNRA